MLVLDSFDVAFSFALWKIQPFHYKVDDYHWGRLVLELNAVGMRHAGYNVNEELGECEEKTPWKLLRIIWIIAIYWNELKEISDFFWRKDLSKKLKFKIAFPKKQKDVTSINNWCWVDLSCLFLARSTSLWWEKPSLWLWENMWMVSWWENIEEEQAAETKIFFAASKMGFVGSRISIVRGGSSLVCTFGMFFNMTWVGMNPKKWWAHQRSTGFSDIFLSASSSQTQLELVGISVVGLVNFEKKQSNASKKGGCFNVHVFFLSHFPWIVQFPFLSEV